MKNRLDGMKLSDLIKLLEKTKSERGDLEIRICTLDEYVPVFEVPRKVHSSNEFKFRKIDMSFVDDNDVCKNGKEFLYFDHN